MTEDDLASVDSLSSVKSFEEFILESWESFRDWLLAFEAAAGGGGPVLIGFTKELPTMAVC